MRKGDLKIWVTQTIRTLEKLNKDHACCLHCGELSPTSLYPIEQQHTPECAVGKLIEWVETPTVDPHQSLEEHPPKQTIAPPHPSSFMDQLINFEEHVQKMRDIIGVVDNK